MSQRSLEEEVRDQKLVYDVGRIYINREDQTVVDANFERFATYAQQLADRYRRRQYIIILPSIEMSESFNRAATICADVAKRFRPRNLSILLTVEDAGQTNALNHNYGDSYVLVLNKTREPVEPLVLDDLDVRQYFNYEFEGRISMTMLSVINLLRRCRGPVTFVHKGSLSFDQPLATIVPPLKTLLSFLWQEASTSDRGKFDLTFTIVLDREQTQEIRQHCIDISPGETHSEVGIISAKLPGPDESTVVYIHMVTERIFLRVYTSRMLTGGGAPVHLEPRWAPRLTSMHS